MLCGCALSESGPWRAASTEVEVLVAVDGAKPRRYPLSFDPATAMFGVDIPTNAPGLYELEVRAWMGASNNAGVARSAFFVH